MNDQAALLDRPPEAAVRALALALLDDAAAAAGELRSDTGADALHDFRVALRRLRTLLEEEESSRAVFERLWSLTAGRQVLKRRYRIEERDRVWEVDEFFDRELVVAETELRGRMEPMELPDWLRPHVVREVTGEDQYLDESLAR